MSSWIKIKGTQTGSFQLGLTGPVLNNNSGNLQLRNSANTANADISVGNVAGNVITGNLVTGTLTTAAQPNITSVGNLTSLTMGSGSISGPGYTFYANGVGLFQNSITTGYIDGTLRANSNDQPFITSLGNLTSLKVVGTSNVGNLKINGIIDFSNTVGIIGNIIPVSNVTYSLGNSTNRFKDLWLSGNTIQLGDTNISTSGNGIALPSANVTTDLSVGGNATITGNTVIAGNLTVAGTTTYVNSTTTSIVDPLIELGGGANGALLTTNDGKARGLLLNYYTSYSNGNSGANTAFMGWKNSGGSGNDGTQAGEFIFVNGAAVSNNNVTVTALSQYSNIRAGNAYFGGNATVYNVTAGGNVSAGYFIGNVTGNVTGSLNGTLTTTGIYGSSGGSNWSILYNGPMNRNTLSIQTIAADNTTSNFNSFNTNLYATGLVYFNNSSNVTLGAVGNLHITGGSNGQVLTTNGNGNLSWSTVSGGGNSSYGDSNVTSLLTSGNIVGNIVFGNNTGTYANIELRGVYSKISAPYALFGYEVGTKSINSSSVSNDANLDLKSAANVNIQAFTGNAYANIISVIGDYPNYASAPRVAIAGNVAITGNISATNLGNIVTINKDGNSSNVLYGNGVFAAAPTGGGNTVTDYWRTTSKTFTYSSNSTISLITLPGSATVDNVTIIVDTAFNGNSPGATVGRSFGGTGLEYVSTGDVDLKTADRYDLPCQIAPTGNTFDIVINYTASSSTAGSARVLITYAVAS
jgi:hypothetical protein